MGRIIGMILGVSVFFALAPTALAGTPTAIDGTCGIKKLSFVPGTGLTRWHVRIGPKHPGGNHRCKGIAKKVNGIAQIEKFAGTYTPPPAGFGLDWLNYNLRSWNWHGIIEVGVKGGITAGACAAFGTALGTGPLTWGASGVIAVAAGAGCVDSAVTLLHTVDDNFRTRK